MRSIRRALERELTGELSIRPLYYNDEGFARLTAAAERALAEFGPPPGWAIP